MTCSKRLISSRSEKFCMFKLIVLSFNFSFILANGHGKNATPENETCHARFPLPSRKRAREQTNRYANFTLMQRHPGADNQQHGRQQGAQYLFRYPGTKMAADINSRQRTKQ